MTEFIDTNTDNWERERKERQNEEKRRLDEWEQSSRFEKIKLIKEKEVNKKEELLERNKIVRKENVEKGKGWKNWREKDKTGEKDIKTQIFDQKQAPETENGEKVLEVKILAKKLHHPIPCTTPNCNTTPHETQQKSELVLDESAIVCTTPTDSREKLKSAEPFTTPNGPHHPAKLLLEEIILSTFLKIQQAAMKIEKSAKKCDHTTPKNPKIAPKIQKLEHSQEHPPRKKLFGVSSLRIMTSKNEKSPRKKKSPKKIQKIPKKKNTPEEKSNLKEKNLEKNCFVIDMGLRKTTRSKEKIYREKKKL